jgi:hypothetical protein
MHEVNNPLEAIGNLVYLTKSRPDDPHQVCERMRLIEFQLDRLGEITRKSLLSTANPKRQHSIW